MGWGSAGQIFDPVADRILHLHDQEKISREDALWILTPLTEELCDGDWDTWGESLERFNDHPVLLEVFRVAGLKTDCDDYRGVGDHTRCHALAPCK